MKKMMAPPFTDDFQRLFGAGTCAGLSDGELLDRFLACRDEGGELAFETLVERHGPMIMRVCRNRLDDPHDVHDAFQAVFLVLARRASTIRLHDSIASWLYGVALRVSARARAASIRRHIRDRRNQGAAQAVVIEAECRPNGSPLEASELADTLHQELGRLPEKLRAPVVLCYLEGLTHDEAAARLGWPVGTVHSRLTRARNRLRASLSRRDAAPPAAIGPMAYWLTADGDVSSRMMATISAGRPAPIEPALLNSIVRAVAERHLGRRIAAGSVPSTSVRLAQGVLHTMMLKKLLVIACAVLPMAMTGLASGLLLAQKPNPPAQATKASADPATSPSAPVFPQQEDIDRLAQQLLKAARNRLETQKAYYEQGRITLDRFIDASNQLELAELRVAKTDQDRLAARRRHLGLIREIEDREKSELAVGRGTDADLSEVHHRLVEAELELMLSLREAGDMAVLTRRLSELERKVERLEKGEKR